MFFFKNADNNAKRLLRIFSFLSQSDCSNFYICHPFSESVKCTKFIIACHHIIFIPRVWVYVYICSFIRHTYFSEERLRPNVYTCSHLPYNTQREFNTEFLGYTVRMVSWQDRITRWMSLLLSHFIIFSCNLLEIDVEKRTLRVPACATQKASLLIKETYCAYFYSYTSKKMFPSYRSARFTWIEIRLKSYYIELHVRIVPQFHDQF